MKKEKRLPDYVDTSRKLSGKKLDEELKYRRKIKDQRISKRIGIREMAKTLGICPTKVLSWEYGYDCCDHKEYKDQVGGFPIPKLLFKVCKRCGMVKENTAEKVGENNLERAYKVCKESMEKIVKKEKEELEKK